MWRCFRSSRIAVTPRIYQRSASQSLAISSRPFLPPPASRVALLHSQLFSPFWSLPKLACRCNSNAATTIDHAVDSASSSQGPAEEASPEREVGAYEITFTCKPCKHRSAHRISHQGYHQGTVLITCPQCRSRHVISDHLKIFSDKSVTVEDLLRDKGELLRKGSRGTDGDIEFLNDGTSIHQRDSEPRPGEDRRY